MCTNMHIFGTSGENISYNGNELSMAVISVKCFIIKRNKLIGNCVIGKFETIITFVRRIDKIAGTHVTLVMAELHNNVIVTLSLS